MKITMITIVLAAFLGLAVAEPGLADPPANDPVEVQNDYPKIGLALSGGGAKGFAHVGVLKVLEEAGMPIDYISGTSMGALIGGLYSIGYTPEELEELILDMNWNDLFSDEIRRRHIPMEEKEWDGLYLLTLPIIERSIRLPTGLVAGQRIGILLNSLTWQYGGYQDFTRFPIPFVCVATDIETGQRVVLKDGYLADAIRSSIAIPSIFMPNLLDDKVLVDGGVVRNLPVEEAFEMGSDFVIGVNVADTLLSADKLTSIIDILDQTVSFQIMESIRKSEEKADFLIRPTTILDYGVTDFEDAAEIIKIGEKAAREHFDQLKALADSIKVLRGIDEIEVPVERQVIPERVYVREINIDGLDNSAENQLINRLMLQPGTFISAEEISEGIENIYGMQFFERVNYRLTKNEDDDYSYTLNISVIEKQQDQFKFGFNYNDVDKAAILLSSTFRNLFSPGSLLRLNLKLGEEPFFDANYFNYLTLESTIAINLRANYNHSKIDLFDTDGNRIVRYNTDAFYLESLFLPVSNSLLKAGVGVRQEFFHISRSVGEFEFPAGASSITQFLGVFNIDNMNRLNFTQRGHRLNLEAGHSVNFFDNSINFFRLEARWNGYFELSDLWTLQTGAWAGLASQSELPLHRQFYLGGYPNLVGFRPYEVASNSIRALKLGLQYEIMRNRFIEVRGNIASESGFWEYDFADTPLRVGWSATFGINTMIGPLRGTLMGSRRNPLLFAYSIGVRF